MIFNKENAEPATEETVSNNTENTDESEFISADESTEAYDETFVYEEDIYIENDYIIKGENLIENRMDTAVIDSIEMALQERIDRENSGEAIVEESDVMMGMIENLAGIPYFEQHKLESSSKSENIYNYAEGFVPTFSVSHRKCMLIDKKEVM